MINYFKQLDKEEKDMIRVAAANATEEIRIAGKRFPGAVGAVENWQLMGEMINRGQLLRFTAKHMRKYGAL